MWATPEGNRVLRGAEGKLFQKALASLAMWLEETDGKAATEVAVFDPLSLPEKLAILEQVARALLREDVPAPLQTAIAEGAIAAVYSHTTGDAEEEIDKGRYSVRTLMLRAAKACDVAEASCPKPDCADASEWRELVGGLMDRIFWDRDWEIQAIKPDDPPELAEKMRDTFGISEGYYSSVGPDPSQQQLQLIRESLQKLCRTKIP